jgi:hypothetical protein
MAIELPSFEDTHCEMLVVCSRVVLPPSVSLPAEEIAAISRYKIPSGSAFIKIFLDHGETTDHLHIEIARRSIFGKTPPTPNLPAKGLKRLLRQFQGLRVKAKIRAYCAVPLTSLSPISGIIFAGSNAVKLRANKTEIELTGAQLTFREAEIDRLRWELVKDEVLIELDVVRDDIIDTNYLAGALEVTRKALATYVLGKKSDDKATP